MKKVLLIALAMTTLACTNGLAQCCNRLGRFVDRSNCCEQTTNCCATPESCDPCARRCRLFDCNLGFSFGGCGCRGLFPLFGGCGNDCNTGCNDCQAQAPASDCCNTCERGSLFGHHHGWARRNNDCGCETDSCCDSGRGCRLFAGHHRGLFAGWGNDCGCETNACETNSCCDTVAPGLWQRHAHVGLFARRGGCGNDCGCETNACCDNARGCGLFGNGCNLFARRANDCGCETDSCCDAGRGCGLFSGHHHGGCGLFGRRSYVDCGCESSCGCNGSQATPANANPAPAAEPQPAAEPAAQPAAQGASTRVVPIVDPNAFSTPSTRFTTGRIK